VNAPREAWFVQPVRIRSELRLAAGSELNPAPGRVTAIVKPGDGIPSHNASEGIEPRNTCHPGCRCCSLCRRQYSPFRYARGGETGGV